MESYKENERVIVTLQSEVSLLRRGIGEEGAGRKQAEAKTEQLQETVRKLTSTQDSMKAEMESTLNDLRRVTRERDAAIQEVVAANKQSRSGADVERIAASKHLLQKALMEQVRQGQSRITSSKYPLNRRFASRSLVRPRASSNVSATSA